MTATTLTHHTTLAQHLLPASRRWGAVLGVVAGSLLMAALAQVSIPVPGTPVPITGQTLGVLLTGVALGPRLGFASLLLYIVEGAIGLPVYAGGAAGIAALLGAHRRLPRIVPLRGGRRGLGCHAGLDRRWLGALAAMLAGSVIIFALGLAWLWMVLHLGGKDVGFVTLLNLGLFPFIPGGLVKAAIGMGLLPTTWRMVERRGDTQR